MNIGRAIRLARVAREQSQQELASEVEISPSYLSLIESGRRDPSLPMIRSIAEALRISEDVLLLTAIEYETLSARDVDTLSVLTERLLFAAVQQGITRRAARKR